MLSVSLLRSMAQPQLCSQERRDSHLTRGAPEGFA